MVKIDRWKCSLSRGNMKLSSENSYSVVGEIPTKQQGQSGRKGTDFKVYCMYKYHK
jgi:hypothetical protein